MKSEGDRMKIFRKRRIIVAAVVLGLSTVILSACGLKEKQKKPVTLTIWHVYGGQTDSPLNDMIEMI